MGAWEVGQGGRQECQFRVSKHRTYPCGRSWAGKALRLGPRIYASPEASLKNWVLSPKEHRAFLKNIFKMFPTYSEVTRTFDESL